MLMRHWIELGAISTVILGLVLLKLRNRRVLKRHNGLGCFNNDGYHYDKRIG